MSGDWRSAWDVSENSDSGGFPNMGLSFFINLVLVFSSLTYPNIDTKLYRQTDLFI